jgi:uncharacterized protein (TIGR02646 family)
VIHTERNEGPAILTDPVRAGAGERARAIAFYADPANADEPFDFQAYGNEAVKRALNELFQYKCAYCESRYAALLPVDVEHFRPKGAVAVNGKRAKPGYYWLAASWDNLLPSCIDCNRARKQDVEGGDARLAGKESQFPLADEAKRARVPGQEAQEEHLLLNPCQDEPSAHIEWREDGFIIPTVIQGAPSSRGAASIEVYALWRSGLVLERAARARLILRDIERARRAIRILDRHPEDPDVETQLTELLEALRAYGAPEEPYAALARTLTGPFLAEVEAMAHPESP